MKKILIFSMTYYPKPVGGAEVAIKEITDRMPIDEYEFHLISLRLDSTVPRYEQFGNVHVHRIGFTKRGADATDFRRFPLHLNKFFYQFWAVYHGWRLHRQHKFDGVWGMMAHSTGVPCGIFSFFFPKVHYVLTLQEGDPLERIESKMRISGPLFRRAFTAADTVQAISTFLADWAKRMGCKEEPVVIPNGVNVDAVKRVSDSEIEKARSKIGKSEDETWIIHTGRFVHKNGLDTIIRALPELPPTVHALFVGEGPQQETLRTIAAANGVTSRTHFHAFVDSVQLGGYLKACDIFVRASRSEGMGISFIEAMAAELPVIATQVGGISDFLFDANRNPDVPATGFAVDVDAPEQIARAVQEILRNREGTKAVIENAREMVAKSYDWDRIAERMQHEVFGRIGVGA